MFSDSLKAQKLIECLKITAEKCHFAAHACCAMPDHFHALVEGVAPDSDLLLFISTFKRATSLEYSAGGGSSLWQKKFYDHVLRAKDSPQAVAWYIWMNPVRNGQCGQANQFPFSGSFTDQWEKRAQPKEVWAPSWKRDGSCPFINRTAASKPSLP